jgi:anhydro-N-acetylmuramic acid kinase
VIEARLVATVHAELSAALQALIAALLPPATTTVEAVCRLDTGFGRALAEVVAPLCAEHGAELVVSDGQTVFHWVEGGTLQLGGPRGSRSGRAAWPRTTQTTPTTWSRR